MDFPRLRRLLSTPVSGESLAIFRIMLGLLMTLEALTLCVPMKDMVSTGRTPLDAYFTDPRITFHTPYPLFEWLPAPSAARLRGGVVALGVSGVCMGLGLFYRVSSVTTFVLWGWLYVAESTRTYWRSDYYLDLLLLFLLMWMPAARRFSLDAWLHRRQGPAGKALPPPEIPFWPVFLLRAQLVIAYFYAGFTKLSADWLLDAAPVRWFLERPGVTEPFRGLLSPSLFGAFEQAIHSPVLAYVISWTGMAFDLSVGFLLLFRRTRLLGLVLMVTFHVTNHFLIFDDIAWFPLVGITTAWIFLNPDWPSTFGCWLRRREIPRPDWKWLAGGAVFIPVLGAALGWKAASPASAPLAPGKQAEPPPEPPVGRWALPGVLAWIALQIIIPLRGHLIAGDERFTWEGLSFSWRLKADTRHAFSPIVSLDDPTIVETRAGQPPVIHWKAWPGETALLRRLPSGPVDWAHLPELLVTLEPGLGERVFYNPMATATPPASEAEARRLATELWTRLHGHPPQSITRTLPFEAVLGRLANGLRSSGQGALADRFARLAGEVRGAAVLRGGKPGTTPAEQAAAKELAELRRLDEEGSLTPYLRPLVPFTPQGERGPSLPLLLVQDPAVIQESPGNHWGQVNRASWKAAPATANEGTPARIDDGAEPLVLHLVELDVSLLDRLPEAFLLESPAAAGQAVAIRWNLARDVTPSRLLHISAQPFFLRRYATRVAGIWQAKTGRRPAVRAVTSVSFNGRPYQNLVDPQADLASVPVSWFRHNPWVTDLQTRRIPPGSLVAGQGAIIGP